MKRDLLIVGGLWLLLAVAGEVLALTVDIYPLARSDKGEEIEKAFRVLVAFAVPVFSLVVSVLAYSMLRYRTSGVPEEDGEPLHGRGAVPVLWFAITAGLTAVVMVYPGLTSLAKVAHVEHNPDLVVKVEGVQWTWLITYPQHDIERTTALILPVDRTVRFEITSLDVLHSFWVPAFLMKIDAVPGKTTRISLRPTVIGSFEADPLLRLQCAELCGLSHSRMTIPVSVVSEEDFEKWVEEEQAGTKPARTSGTTTETLDLQAQNLRFDKETLEAAAGESFAIRLDNRDEGVQHNIAIYEDESAHKALFVGEIFEGPEARTEEIPALDAGTYFFRCDVHPNTMKGELNVR